MLFNDTVSYADYTVTNDWMSVSNVFSGYNHQDANFLNLFISVRRSTCFRRVFSPSSGAQNCTYSVRHCQSITATCCQRGRLAALHMQPDACDVL